MAQPQAMEQQKKTRNSDYLYRLKSVDFIKDCNTYETAIARLQEICVTTLNQIFVSYS